MVEIMALIFAQLDKLVPERSRVRILACLSFIGLGIWIYISAHTFAKKADIESLRQGTGNQISTAVQPLTDALNQDRRIANDRWIDQLNTEIIQAEGRCRESKNTEAQGLYKQEIGGLLERYQNVAGHVYPQAGTLNCQ